MCARQHKAAEVACYRLERTQFLEGTHTKKKEKWVGKFCHVHLDLAVTKAVGPESRPLRLRPGKRLVQLVRSSSASDYVDGCFWVDVALVRLVLVPERKEGRKRCMYI